PCSTTVESLRSAARHWCPRFLWAAADPGSVYAPPAGCRGGRRIATATFTSSMRGDDAHRGAVVAGVRRESPQRYQQDVALDLRAHHRREPRGHAVVAAYAAHVAGGLAAV